MPTHTHILYTIDLDCQPQSPKRRQGEPFRYNAVVVRVMGGMRAGEGRGERVFRHAHLPTVLNHHFYTFRP